MNSIVYMKLNKLWSVYVNNVIIIQVAHLEQYLKLDLATVCPHIAAAAPSTIQEYIYVRHKRAFIILLLLWLLCHRDGRI